MSVCPAESDLLDYLVGDGAAAARDAIRAHLADCSLCLSLAALLVKEAPGGDGEPGATPALSAAGPRIGSYRIQRELGCGGMGVVYLAEQEPIGRLVALKVLHPRLAAHPTIAARFLTEARAQCAVHHPGLVAVTDYGHTPEGVPYLVMEYLSGITLRAGFLAFREAGDLARGRRALRQVALAVAVAHQAGIVHRDLKPDNVMLVPDPETPGEQRVKVVDFGLAKLPTAMDVRSGHSTAAGVLLGTPAYMAPEQCRGASEVDGSADVYALGVMLYELYAGAPPFAGPTALDFVAQHLLVTPRPLAEVCADADPALCQLVAAMLAKDPQVRPLLSVVAATLAAPPVLRARSAALVRRRGALIIAAVSLVAIGAGLAAGPAGGLLRRAREGLRARSNPRLIVLPGGTFTMGSTPEEREAAFQFCERLAGAACKRDFYEREGPPRQVTLSPFALEETEVTNQRFVRWLNSAPGLQVQGGRLVYSAPDGAGRAALLLDLYPSYGYAGISHAAGRFAARRGMEHWPVVQVSWRGAAAFCAAQHLRLPTEAEWEYAARGGGAQRRFPWGDTMPDCAGVVQSRVRWRKCEHIERWLQEVGTAPQDRSLHGVRDLGGSVSEWVQDALAVPYPTCGACQDVVERGSAGYAGDRVVRGGSWNMPAESCRAAGRIRWPQEGVGGNIGFRCARDEVNP